MRQKRKYPKEFKLEAVRLYLKNGRRSQGSQGIGDTIIYLEDMETSLLIETFSKALKTLKPKRGCVFHSDRGVQYASSEFRKELEKHNMIQSMSRKGECYDNSCRVLF